MADTVNEQFDDPKLKSAVRRCWACDCAPAELRQRVMGMLEHGSPSHRSSSGSLRMPLSTWLLAAAAVLVLMIGLSYRFWPAVQPLPQQTLALASLPPALPGDLAARHDQCCKSHNHQFPNIPRDNDAAIVTAMQSQLSHAVLVARPTDPGWDFHGAAICPVGTTPAGHLVFSRGSDTLSIFSLPRTAAPDLKDGEEFTTAAGNHAITGFVKNNAVFCLVSNSPAGTLTASDLKKMRTQMEASVTVARSDTPEPVVIAELLRNNSN